MKGLENKSQLVFTTGQWCVKQCAHRHVNAQVWVWAVHLFCLCLLSTSFPSFPIYFGLDSGFFPHRQPLIS